MHPRFRTPHVTTILTGLFVAAFSAVTNINEMVELTNIGTLFAFILVAVGVIAAPSRIVRARFARRWCRGCRWLPSDVVAI